MGASFTLEEGNIIGSCPRLHGAEINLDMPTVGGTENLIMAAVLAEGTTLLCNAAREPEICDLADFLISNNLLFAGTLLFLFFCTSRRGWGWENFLAETNAGKGLRFPSWLRVYLRWVLPCLILLIFIMGYVERLEKLLR